jgi:hypothetical protein
MASIRIASYSRQYATSPPAVIPAEHSARLIELGYMVDLEGTLRMTTPGRIRIYAGQLAD